MGKREDKIIWGRIGGEGNFSPMVILASDSVDGGYVSRITWVLSDLAENIQTVHVVSRMTPK